MCKEKGGGDVDYNFENDDVGMLGTERVQWFVSCPSIKKNSLSIVKRDFLKKIRLEDISSRTPNKLLLYSILWSIIMKQLGLCTFYTEIS